MFSYNPPKPKKYCFDPKSTERFKLSRSGLESFINCPRCFYLDKRFGVAQPPGYPFTLNSAVDTLLKKEFDIHRADKTVHPLMQKYGIDAVPLAHKNLNSWRENFVGVQALHKPTNLLITGAVDDIWVDKNGQLMVVDYKATSTERETNTTDEKWGSYFRQMEIYQWLLRRNGFKVSNTGYFVYCNGRKDRKAFDGKLEFDIEIVKHDGNEDWVEKAITDAKECLTGKNIPEYSKDCDFCKYRIETEKIELQRSGKTDSEQKQGTLL
jgi:CRISPR/Cas system-associated exonuclease Cas4 (RecB family)